MSVYTEIKFLNGNDPEFLAAKNGTPEQQAQWLEDNGPFEDRPGSFVQNTDDLVTETEDEYGGWLIAVKDIPKEATHILIYRS